MQKEFNLFNIDLIHRYELGEASDRYQRAVPATRRLWPRSSGQAYGHESLHSWPHRGNLFLMAARHRNRQEPHPCWSQASVHLRPQPSDH